MLESVPNYIRKCSKPSNTILGSGLAPVASANSRSETAWERPLGNWPQRGFTGCSSVPDLYLLSVCLSVCEFYVFICTRYVTLVGMSACMWVLYFHLYQICYFCRDVYMYVSPICSSQPDLLLLSGCVSVSEFYMFPCNRTVRSLNVCVLQWIMSSH